MRWSPGQIRFFFNSHSSPGFLHPPTTGLSTGSPWNCPPCPQPSVISATAHACRSGRRSPPSPKGQRRLRTWLWETKSAKSCLITTIANGWQTWESLQRFHALCCYLTNLSPSTVWLKLSKSYRIDQTGAFNLLRALVCSSSPSEQS